MITLSAGHYPERPGACYKNHCEHGEASIWVDIIMSYMNTNVAAVTPGPLKHKVAEINDIEPTLAIEIHFNSAVIDGRNIGRGCETLYYPGSDRGAYVAHELQTAISPLLFSDRGVKEGWYRMDKKNGPDFFLAKTKCTSIIMEPEFIYLTDSINKHRDEACRLIAVTLDRLNNETQ